MATKAEELKVLSKIRSLVESLGPDSYVGTALDGCLDLAKTNIEWDAAFSMKNRWEKELADRKEWQAEAYKLQEEVTAKLALIDKLHEELEAEKEKYKDLLFKFDGKCFDYDMLAQSTKDCINNTNYWMEQAEDLKNLNTCLLERNNSQAMVIDDMQKEIEKLQSAVDSKKMVIAEKSRQQEEMDEELEHLKAENKQLKGALHQAQANVEDVRRVLGRKEADALKYRQEILELKAKLYDYMVADND